MDYLANLQKAVKIIFLDKDEIISISKDENATLYGFITLGIAGFLVSGLDITGSFLLIIGFFVSYSFYHFAAKFIFGGKATGTEYFRTLSNAFMLYWILILPVEFLEYIVALWIMVLNIFILSNVHKLSKTKAIVLGLLPLLISLVFIAAWLILTYNLLGADLMPPPGLQP